LKREKGGSGGKVVIEGDRWHCWWEWG
jgi:hypothetical protein